jgi:hypothetical protein
LLFENADDTPINHNSFNKYHIKKHALNVCARYCGPYGGRHGAGTELYNRTGDMRAAFQVLGNSFAVVSKHYTKPDGAQGKAGLVIYEEALRAAEALKLTR